MLLDLVTKGSGRIGKLLTRFPVRGIRGAAHSDMDGAECEEKANVC